MTKYAVLPGMEITFDDVSVAIKALDDGDDRGPEAVLECKDGSTDWPDLNYGRWKVVKRGVGITSLKNIGWNALEVEVPAPPRSNPKTHK